VVRAGSQINQLILRLCGAQFIWLVSLRFNRRLRLVPIVWHRVDVIVSLGEFPSFELTLVCWRILFGGIIVRIEVFTLPVCAHEASRFFEVRSKVNVLLFPKYFCLHSSTRLGPLVQNLFRFFVSSFFLEFSVLMFKPDWFEFLFSDIVCWVIVEVRGTTFKPVLGFKLHWFLPSCRLISRIECIKRFSPYCFFWLVERWSIRGTRHSLVISKSSARDVKCISNMREHEACLVWLSWLKYSFLLFSIFCFTLLDFIDTYVVIFQFFTIKILDSNVCWWNVFMKSTFTILLIFEHSPMPLLRFFFID